MDSRVTSMIAAGRAESGRGLSSLSLDSASASGRSVVTRADEGVAPSSRVAAQVDTTGGVGELPHEPVRVQLSDYIDDSLGESSRRRIDGHLSQCAPCTAVLSTMRETVRALGRLPVKKAPSGAVARIVEQARREHEQQRT